MTESNVDLLVEREAAAILTIKPRTLTVWRQQGIGPKYIKLGTAVRYRRADVEAWLQARTVDPKRGNHTVPLPQ